VVGRAAGAGGGRLNLVAVGRWPDGAMQALFHDYARRLRPPLGLIEVEERRPLPPADRQAREGALLLAAVPAGARRVVLDAAGRMPDSAGFARDLARWREQAPAGVAFLVGGADGHAADVLAQAEERLSLGPLTWPHMLVRVLLAEQLYRADAILRGHPYHRT